MGIYQADVFCDDCINEIKKRLTAEGKAPEDPDDETSFDSDDYPKGAYPDDEPSDCPQHCGAGADCLNALVLSDGRKYGCLIGNGLTEEGEQYVKEAVKEASESPRACCSCGGAGIKGAVFGAPGYCAHCGGVSWASVALECWRQEFDWIEFPPSDIEIKQAIAALDDSEAAALLNDFETAPGAAMDTRTLIFDMCKAGKIKVGDIY